ncbi:MAG: TonB C-terminal domain-containing protein [Polyangiaceae bacterium]
MPRDAHIPLFLWLATALLVHLLSGGGMNRAADWMEERIEMRRFAEGVRSYMRTSNPVEVALLDETQPQPDPTEEPPPADAEKKPEKDDTSDAEDEKERLPDPEQKKELEKPEPEKKEPEKEKEKPPEPEKKKDVTKVDAEKQELALKKNIAVRQHVEDEKQPDNPDAKFISEHNNKVAEETQAKITSNDQDDKQPTPGSNASGVGEQPGDSHETRVAQSEDRAGEEARAPHDEPAPQRPKTSDEQPNAGAPRVASEQHSAPPIKGAEQGREKPTDQRTAAVQSPGSKGQAEQREQLGAPEVMESKQGAFNMARPELAQAEQEARRARAKRELPRRKARGAEDFLGLGAAGTTASGINLNLTPGLARDAIGADTLSRERLADGARRRSQHMGSWKSAGIERWRSAIENYVPMVKPGNQTALNSARSPFAMYLAAIHNKLHPIFADWFLASLDSLPASHPMNNRAIYTSLEIILDQDEGRIVNQGVTRTSGVTAFDINALESVQRAGPFGTPPREIVSGDGRVYLHWEFHREPAIACTTYNARPYILKARQKTAPPPEPSKPEPDQNAPEERHGSLETPNDARRARAL